MGRTLPRRHSKRPRFRCWRRSAESTPAALLYVSPGQINFLVPEGLATGVATFTINNGGSALITAVGAVGQVAPAVFSVNGTGVGLAAATAVSVTPQGQRPLDLTLPIDVSAAPVYLTLYATGIRNRTSVDNVLVTVNGVDLPVTYAGAQPTFAGLDQINVQLPSTLRGAGVADIVLKVDQHRANVATVSIQ
jgi:uncharacterized protein (TIGR03437 family)